MHCEWKDKQPGFKKEVKLNGEKIATIHALTKSDYAKISDKSNGFKNLVEANIWFIYYSLNGHDCGWNFDREVTYENIGLLPDDEFNAIAKAINNFEEQNKVEDDLVKN